jgi:hypothetical protein
LLLRGGENAKTTKSADFTSTGQKFVSKKIIFTKRHTKKRPAKKKSAAKLHPAPWQRK